MSFRQTRVLISSAVRTPPSRRLRHQPRSHNKQMLLSSPSTPLDVVGALLLGRCVSDAINEISALRQKQGLPL